MENKTIVITGASDGIGKAAAKELKSLGNNVIIVGRSKEKTESVAKELDCPYYLVDYADLDQVVKLANELRKLDRIDVLANNAGGVQNERQITKDGFEKTFQINHLGSFLLTYLLLDKLCECNATVIQTSSIAANMFSAFDIDDLNNEKDYTPFKAYGNGKLENILFIRELDRRYKSKGINAVAFEPGVVRTNFGAGSIKFVEFAYHSFLKYFFTISPEKSTKRLIWLSIAKPDKDFKTGSTYTKKKIMDIKFKDQDGKVAEELWNKSLKMIEKYIKNDTL